MSNKQIHSSPYEILGQTEVMDGDTKVIITEYVNGAKSYRNIRPKRPFYKHVWFYIFTVVACVALLATVR